MKHLLLELVNKISLTVVVAIGLLLPLPALCQANYLHVTANEKGPSVPYRGNYGTLKSAISDSVIYFSPAYPVDKEIRIYTHDLRTRENGSLVIENPKQAKAILSDHIASFAVNRGKVVIVGTNHLFVLRQTSSTTMRFEGMLANKEGFMKCLPLGDRFLLYVQYNYHPLDAPHTHVWAVLDPLKQEVTQLQLQPDENAVFGSLVNSWIDTYRSKIVYADPLTYRITFYNERFEPTDSIRSDELDANEPYVTPFRTQDMHSRDAIRSLMEVDDSLLTRIRKVWYLDDSTVAALIVQPGQTALRVDYWQKTNGTWNRIYQDHSTSWFIDGGSYSKDRVTYSDFYQNVFDLLYTGDATFYLPYFPYIPTVSTAHFDRNADYFNLQNDVIRTNSTSFGIRTIQIALPAR